MSDRHLDRLPGGQLREEYWLAAPAYRIPTVPQRIVVERITPEREIASVQFEQSLPQRWHRLTTPLPLNGAAAMVETADGGLLLARQLAARMPWFEQWADVIEAECRLQLAVGRPWLQIPPTLLVGPPGVGKSHAARLLARLSGCGKGALDLAGSTDNRILEGTSRGFSSTRPCWPIEVIDRTGCANPLLIVDEVEKAGRSERNGDPLQTLLPMLEPSTARSYHDNCLLAEADLSGCSWILTANAVDTLPRPLRSRLQVIEVGLPTRTQVGSVLDGIISELAAEWQISTCRLPPVPASVRRQLLDGFEQSGSIRALRQQLRYAIGQILGWSGMMAR